MTIEFSKSMAEAIRLKAFRLNTTKKGVIVSALKLAAMEESVTKSISRELGEGLSKLAARCNTKFTDEELEKYTNLEEVATVDEDGLLAIHSMEDWEVQE